MSKFELYGRVSTSILVSNLKKLSTLADFLNLYSEEVALKDWIFLSIRRLENLCQLYFQRRPFTNPTFQQVLQFFYQIFISLDGKSLWVNEVRSRSINHGKLLPMMPHTAPQPTTCHIGIHSIEGMCYKTNKSVPLTLHRFYHLYLHCPIQWIDFFAQW